MNADLPKLYTISAGTDPLRVLVRRVLAGFPGPDSGGRPLSHWRILLPTRRAVREMQRMFAEESGRSATLLPRILPLGDLDADLITAGNDSVTGIDPALTPSEQLFDMMRLVRRWGDDNPQLALAREVSASVQQAFRLAMSLVRLINQIETEEVKFENLTANYDRTDLAGHREAITGLLDSVQVDYPDLLRQARRMGPAQRRNALIRLEAERIRQGAYRGPVIAAGSTGSNPATRELLKAILEHPQGAVVLPGLDLAMADADWLMVAQTPTHPQWNLKQLVDHLGQPRAAVTSLAGGDRAGLLREVMRPALSTDQWVTVLARSRDALRAETAGVTLIEADDRHLEARTIALILRQAVTQAGKRAALITPDRDLALRVKTEMLRWNIVIDDTAGEYLTHFGRASLLARLFDILLTDFSPAAIAGLIHHDLCEMGMDRATCAAAARALDAAVLRQAGVSPGAQGLARAMQRAAHGRIAAPHHLHPVAARVDDQAWSHMQQLAEALTEIFLRFDLDASLMIDAHIRMLRDALDRISPTSDASAPENQAFEQILADIASAAARLGPVTLAAAASIILHQLGAETLHAERKVHARLAIYGLQEARMMPADIVILGGLNEGKWPTQPDPGPWLNRPMRESFGLTPPERDIGVTAHDFCEGFSYGQVYLTWSKREGAQPIVPSRWVLRLRTILEGIGIASSEYLDTTWPSLARRIDDTGMFKPRPRPQFAPPVAARPRHYAVTEIETLIRDPYAIYARKVLRLEPLAALAAEPNPGLRGELYHAAFESWNRQWPYPSPAASHSALISAARQHLTPYADDPYIAAFWWPQFERIAAALCSAENEHSDGVKTILAELAGRFSFKVADEDFALSARLDRLDIRSDGTAHIIDYKTGTPPTATQVRQGWNPQLTLQAYMLANGGFQAAGRAAATAASYVRASGRRPPVEWRSIFSSDKPSELASAAHQDFTKLAARLSHYLDPASVYLPRRSMTEEEDPATYDHLSRFREWILARD